MTCPGSNQQIQLITRSGGYITDRRCPVCNKSFLWHELTGKLLLAPAHCPVGLSSKENHMYPSPSVQMVNLAELTGPPGPVQQPADCPGFGRELPPRWECPACPLMIQCYEAFEKNDEEEEKTDE